MDRGRLRVFNIAPKGHLLKRMSHIKSSGTVALEGPQTQLSEYMARRSNKASSEALEKFSTIATPSQPRRVHLKHGEKEFAVGLGGAVTPEDTLFLASQLFAKVLAEVREADEGKLKCV